MVPFRVLRQEVAHAVVSVPEDKQTPCQNLLWI